MRCIATITHNGDIYIILYTNRNNFTFFITQIEKSLVCRLHLGMLICIFVHEKWIMFMNENVSSLRSFQVVSCHLLSCVVHDFVVLFVLIYSYSILKKMNGVENIPLLRANLSILNLCLSIPFNSKNITILNLCRFCHIHFEFLKIIKNLNLMLNAHTSIQCG